LVYLYCHENNTQKAVFGNLDSAERKELDQGDYRSKALWEVHIDDAVSKSFEAGEQDDFYRGHQF
jgi:hypothetical protein